MSILCLLHETSGCFLYSYAMLLRIMSEYIFNFTDIYDDICEELFRTVVFHK